MNTLYKDKNGQVYSISPIQKPQDGWVKLTSEEVEAHLNPKPTTEQALTVKIAEAKKYLLDTDHKFYIGYVPKDGEDLDATLALRNEKREFIRANE